MKHRQVLYWGQTHKWIPPAAPCQCNKMIDIANLNKFLTRLELCVPHPTVRLFIEQHHGGDVVVIDEAPDVIHCALQGPLGHNVGIGVTVTLQPETATTWKQISHPHTILVPWITMQLRKLHYVTKLSGRTTAAMPVCDILHGRTTTKWSGELAQARSNGNIT